MVRSAPSPGSTDVWVFTTDGFYSAVEYSPDPSYLLVRCRTEDDMRRLADRLGESDIQRTPAADYGWRLVVSRPAWVRYLAQSIDQMDYPNFKEAVHHRLGAERAAVYLDVWANLLRLQRS
jgi:hypothetical protein